jgi:hypothetical protein
MKLEAVRNCLPCQLIWLRLRSVPDTAGRWGKLLSAILAASWAATLWNNGPGLSELAGEGPLIELFGRHLAAVWMTAVAVVPVAGMASGVIPLRIFAATLGLATWSSLLLEMIFQDGSMRPTMGACLAGILGCLNADIRLARMTAEMRD